MNSTIDKQIRNCLVAIDMVKSLPPEKFTKGLSSWTCGSAACFGGWVAVHPFFKKQGVVRVSEDGSPTFIGSLYGAASEVSRSLFGSYVLFDYRAWGELPGLSDKQVVLYRLKRALNALLDAS